MGKKNRGWRRVASVGAAVCGLAFVWTLGQVRPEAGGQSAAGPAVAAMAGPPGTLRADIAIRQRQVRADGRPGRADSPPMFLRLDRQQAAGRWLSTLTFRASPATIRTGAGLVPLENPFEVARLEIDEETGRGRLFDRSGRAMALPTSGDRDRFGVSEAQLGTGWRDRFQAAVAQGAARSDTAAAGAGFFLDSGGTAARRARLAGRMRRAAGQVRGLDRFLAVEGGQTIELLADPVNVAPVEINTIDAGILRSRLSMAYTAAGGAGLVRHSLVSEKLLGPAATDDRLVTEVTLSNVALAAGGVQ